MTTLANALGSDPEPFAIGLVSRRFCSFAGWKKMLPGGTSGGESDRQQSRRPLRHSSSPTVNFPQKAAHSTLPVALVELLSGLHRLASGLMPSTCPLLPSTQPIAWRSNTTSPGDAPVIVELAQLGNLAAIAIGANDELYAVSNAGTVARVARA